MARHAGSSVWGQSVMGALCRRSQAAHFRDWANNHHPLASQFIAPCNSGSSQLSHVPGAFFLRREGSGTPDSSHCCPLLASGTAGGSQSSPSTLRSSGLWLGRHSHYSKGPLQCEVGPWVGRCCIGFHGNRSGILVGSWIMGVAEVWRPTREAHE